MASFPDPREATLPVRRKVRHYKCCLQFVTIEMSSFVWLEFCDVAALAVYDDRLWIGVVMSAVLALLWCDIFLASAAPCDPASTRPRVFIYPSSTMSAMMGTAGMHCTLLLQRFNLDWSSRPLGLNLANS